MKQSAYFRELGETYCADMKDFSFDFEGKNVLQKNLRGMRGQFAELLPLIDVAPDMVARVFHAAFTFKNPQDAAALLLSAREKLPSWKSLNAKVEVADWAQALVRQVLQEEGGEAFLATAAGLDFIFRRPEDSAVQGGHDDDPAKDDSDDSEVSNADRDGYGDGDGDDGHDLGEAGQGWLEEQGFDRRDGE